MQSTRKNKLFSAVLISANVLALAAPAAVPVAYAAEANQTPATTQMVVKQVKRVVQKRKIILLKIITRIKSKALLRKTMTNLQLRLSQILIPIKMIQTTLKT